MWSRFVLGFLLAITTKSPESGGETVKTPLTSKADIFRLLLNQETLIRSYLEKKVFRLVNDVQDMKETMVKNKIEIIYLKNKTQHLKARISRQLRKANKEIAALKKKNREVKAKTSKQLNHAEKESLALNNEIQTLKGNFQNQANETKFLSADVEESKKTQIKLLSAVSSLEVLRNNVSSLSSLVKETTVAFTVGMSQSSGSLGVGGAILVFPHVITNTGHGYNTTTGKFTAPRRGNYVFFVTTVSFHRNDLNLDIVHDGVSKVRTMSYSSAWQTGTNLAVLELDRGDHVWVGHHYGKGYASGSVPYTTFSGFLL